MGTSVAEQPKATKSEPLFAVDKPNRTECYPCGALIWNIKRNAWLKYVDACFAQIGTSKKSCNQKYPQRKRDMQQRMRNERREPRGTNYVSEEEDELEDD